MNEVKISLGDAKVLYNTGGVSKKIALLAYSEKELIKLPKTWEEFCEMNSINKRERYIGTDSYLGDISSDANRDWITDKNVLPNLEAANAHLALMQLHQLRNFYRHGWTPNWYDSSDKWVINYYNGGYDVSICLNKRFLTF